MTAQISDLNTVELRRAARQFVRALAAEALLHAAARVEARLNADDAGSLFAVDEALSSAWPPDGTSPPRQEVIWSAGGAQDLRLSAFDAAGRVLLRRSYAAGAWRKGDGHV
ncbi:hypothetical protein [Phenylobacterium sp.]|jgi:hypothetical protein|uniref:hypothetical protein n=1 Tax=Phenylobacterium sp. TaxID=1871053 RepID=UPI002E30D33D|nr:hypothetical protein [Phenylobacterium sp.]HEX4713207.1 hypothetical protein [Phenylobacterium sp.]